MDDKRIASRFIKTKIKQRPPYLIVYIIVINPSLGT